MAKAKTITKNDGITAGDSIVEVVDQIYSEEIQSGKFFKKSFEDHIQRFSPDMIMKLIDKIDSYSPITLIVDFGLNKKVINEWFSEYEKFRTKLKFTNKQLTIHSTTPEQAILFYYLIELGIINQEILNSILPSAKQKSMLFAYLFNKSEDNVRLALRDVNIKAKSDKYYTKDNLDKLLKLAQNIKCKELEEMVNKDIRKRGK